MGLAVKIDEDLPARVSDLLRSAGHQAETVVGQGMGGAVDLLRRVLEGKGLEPLWGTVTVVAPRGVRIRRS
jgi:hypothetical protein